MGRQFGGSLGDQLISLLYGLPRAFWGLLSEGQAGPSRAIGVMGD